MLLVTINKPHRLLHLNYIGKVTVAELDRGLEEMKSMLTEFKDGFRVLADLDRLEQLCEAHSDTPTPDEQLRFQMLYWGLIAKGTGNPMLQQQVRWWARLMRDVEGRARASGAVHAIRPGSAPRSAYRALSRALRQRKGAVMLWMSHLTKVLDWTEAQPAHPLQQRKRAPRPKDG